MEPNSEPFFLDYARLSHHKSMMSDSVRVGEYRRAITAVVRPGDVVVDLGCGTGILSFIAARCGARVVYAVERTDIIHAARRIATDNRIDNVVFMRADSSEAVLPEKCDVLLSECLGYMAIQENMVTDFFRFREKWLKPGGKVIPLDAELYFAPVECDAAYESVRFWDDVEVRHGFDYKALRRVAANSASHEFLYSGRFLADPRKGHRIDFTTDASAAVQCEMRFTIARGGVLQGIGGFFTAALSPGVVLDTSPATATHWRQHFYPLFQPVNVNPGSVVAFTVQALLKKAMVDWVWTVQVDDGVAELHDTRQGIRLKE